jgi:hypothetical protein
MGLQILTAGIAHDLNLISLPDAQDIAERSITALFAVETDPVTGLLPHWLQDGQIHPDSEWTSVDSAIACIASVQGLVALGMVQRTADVFASLVDDINFPAFSAPTGEISHGLEQDGSLIPFYWTQWGGELTVVEVWRAMHNPDLPAVPANRNQEHHRGAGFILELAPLFFSEYGAPAFGPDQYGVDWHSRRAQHAGDQAAYPGLIGPSEFGLSAVEIMRFDDAMTGYLVAGVGTTNPPSTPRHTLSGFGIEPWLAPHYMSMVAALDVGTAEKRIERMRDELEVWPPLNGPTEAFQINLEGNANQWNPVQTSLNAAFNVIGLYHGICIRDGRVDTLYAAVDSDVRLREAVHAVFCGSSVNAADVDSDGDVDLADFSRLAACIAGASESAARQCRCLDLDVDRDVDTSDYAAFRAVLTGPL